MRVLTLHMYYGCWYPGFSVDNNQLGLVTKRIKSCTLCSGNFQYVLREKRISSIMGLIQFSYQREIIIPSPCRLDAFTYVRSWLTACCIGVPQKCSPPSRHDASSPVLWTITVNSKAFPNALVLNAPHPSPLLWDSCSMLVLFV